MRQRQRIITMIVIAAAAIARGGDAARAQPAGDPAAGQPAVAPPAERRTPPPPQKPRTRGSRKDEDKWNIPRENIPERMRLVSFESQAVKQFVNYVIYLPPDYETNRRLRYPVIYWLPGHAGDCREAGPMVQKIDEAIRAGQIPPMIVVGVQGVLGSYYVDARDGGRPIETVIVRELIDRIDNTFRTIPDREHRALEGFSMGAWGAGHLAFKYPDLFGVVSMISPPVGTLQFFQQDAPHHASDVWRDDQQYFDANDPYLLVERNVNQIRGQMKIRLYCGGDDRYLVLCEDLHARLNALGIAHEYRIAPGARHNGGLVLGGLAAHVLPFWRDAFPQYVPPPPTTTPTGRQ